MHAESNVHHTTHGRGDENMKTPQTPRTQFNSTKQNKVKNFNFNFNLCEFISASKISTDFLFCCCCWWWWCSELIAENTWKVHLLIHFLVGWFCFNKNKKKNKHNNLVARLIYFREHLLAASSVSMLQFWNCVFFFSFICWWDTLILCHCSQDSLSIS